MVVQTLHRNQVHAYCRMIEVANYCSLIIPACNCFYRINCFLLVVLVSYSEPIQYSYRMLLTNHYLNSKTLGYSDLLCFLCMSIII